MSRKGRRAVYVISVAADLAGMHPQTLRIYERKGLVDPYRTPGGTRRYSQADIDRLKMIQELTGQGLNLEGVKQVIDLQNEVERLQEKVRSLKKQMLALAEESERRIRETHRSYRRDIVLRSDTLPDVKR